tara:strand:+ start:113 stop:262 length:150 start_codon:yes stop_codon:yes gene_type:complete
MYYLLTQELKCLNLMGVANKNTLDQEKIEHKKPKRLVRDILKKQKIHTH